MRRVLLADEGQGEAQDARIIPTARLIERFIDWICGGVPVENDIMAGLRVQRLIEAAQESNRLQRWVEVPACAESMEKTS